MPPAAPVRLALALGLGLWLGALAGGPGRGCGPCEPPCLCGPAPGAACRVNCSGRGLRTLGPALRIPADATALDVSHNLLRALDVGLLANLSALAELDISNNKISTLEEGIFANLFNLSEINLSGNPFECDCGLAWLPRWAEEQQVRVVQPEAATCAGPGSLAGQPLLGIPLLDSGCGEEYVACLPDNSSGTVAAVSFSAAHEGLLQPEACSAFCFSTGQGLAALSEQGWCLCGAAQPSSASFACLSLCSSPPPPPAPTCRGRTLLQHVFPASPGAALVGPHGPLASGRLAAFHIAAPLPVTATRWDFGDGSPEVDAAGPAASHRYVLPGRYHVTAVLALGAGSALLGTDVQVEAAPATLELVCPSSVQSDESLDLSIRNRGGSGLEAAYSIVALGEEPARAVHPLCPSDTEIFPGSGHCYRLVVEKAAWLQAQEQCRAWAGAALAMVDSPAVQRFLVSRVTRSLDVWIGFSTVQGVEVGPAPQGEAFSLESCQNWLPGEPHPATAEHCVRLGPTGWCNTDLCSAPHSYVCELRPGGPVQDAENLLVGAPSGDLQGPLTPLAQQDGLSAPHEPVEVMVFPGLRLSREAFLTTLRLQVYRLLSTAGTPENGSEPESRSPDNRTQLVPACMPGGCWCPGANICLPLDASCHPQACANGCTSGPGLPGAPYALWREFLFSVPAGPPRAVLGVTLHGQDVLMLPGDLVGLQHDAGPSALLHCSPAPSHPGPQAPYLSANASSWLPHLPAQLEGTWACPACALRLLAATEQLTVLLGLRPNPGLRLPGRYEVRAEVGNGVSRHNLSCSFDVVSPVAGLRVIYPAPHHGRLYVPTNGSALVLQVDSGANATATARWPGGSVSARFENACPALVATFVPGCPWETNDTLFSAVALPWLSEGEHVMDVVVENSASRANLSLRVTAEEPICGLRATPSPEARVLQGVLVRYSPVVEAGSDMVFRWTINDKQSLTFQNVVFNSAAVFKLSLTASNHVSNVTVNYNVTVERMNRMQGLRVSTVPAVLSPNATLALTAGVLVDSAVEVAFLWTFGDGEQALHQFQPPYNESFPVPDPSVAQVLVEHNVTHTYAAPGEYILTVLASNAFENLTQQVPVSVRTSLPSVAVGVSDGVLVAGRPVTFYPHPLPSPGGVLYTWDFGDGSPVLTQSQPAANHTYASRGTYHVRLEVNNTVSGAAAQADVRVFEELRGLSVDMSLAVEQGAPVVVSAAVQTGDNITWTFDMGDGTVLSGPEATVEHVYLRAQNCTVTVGAASPAGHLAQSLHVLVFVLEVLRIEPAACIPTQPHARLTAYVTGNPAHYLFDWTFGDGSSNTTVRGCPTVTHNFTRSGTFPLALVLSSRVNRAHYFTSICVEPEVGNVTLQPERQFVQLGDEARLVACAWPPFPYRYTWDFGTEEAGPARAGGPEVTCIYRDPGSYLVTVTASNNISAANDSALVEVQEPVLVTSIKVNGSLGLELQQPYLFSVVGRGRPASYVWDLGDGGRLEGPEVTHAYNSTGDFTVRVAGWNEVSHSEAWLNVTVKRRVRGLVVNASRTVVPLNGSVSFSTSLEAGSDVRYSWVLCDRCTPIPGGPTISYTFRSVGTFNIIVTAENEVGSAQDSIFVYVLQLIEGLQVVGGGRYFPTNHTVQLQAVVRDGTNISYSWTAWRDRGPALAGSGKGFSLTALEAGTYHVRLRATNMLGSAWADCTVDFVEPVGWLMVAASPNPAAVNTSVTLCAELAGGSGVVYTWSLEEGLSWETTEPFTTHSFPTPGLHLVTMTAGNPLGSANATMEVDVQVPVSGLSIRASEPGGSFVAAGSSVPFWGQLATGTNVSWCWVVPGGSSKRGPHVTMVFPDAGTFSIRLNASNAVSWVSATYNLTVEEPIVGLVLWASSKVVAPGQPVHFQILLAAGSAVTFRLQVGGASPEVLPGPRFSHSFPRVGDHVVSVQGKNHVSWAQAQVRIVVLEAVSGLQVPNCCESGIATGTERNFTARVQRGSRVAYAWYFSLQKVQGDSLVILSGRDVTYTPVAAGLLEIQVRAFNALGSENRTLVLEVQDAVQYVALRSGPCFTNRSAQFEATTSPSPRRVAYHWDFGDGSPGQDTDEPRAEHSYLRPGDYRVQVNASNLVSFFVAQATVTVQVLACREPEVDVVLPLQVLMRRSQRNYLEAHVDLRDCVTYQTEYRWEVYRTASCQRPGRPARVALPGVDVSRPQLVLPRLALPVGHYCFVFVVSFGDTPLARSIQANVTVAPERLVPIIEGGSYRVWSDTQDLVLDGSESYDPNLEDGDQTPLSFHWACVASTQREAGGCALNFGPRGSSTVTIPRERLAYTFSLTVWKAGRKEEATNQTVLIRSGRVPIVSLECVSCKAQAVYEVSRSSYVYLEGRCLNCSSGSKRGRWAARTFSNKTLVLDETTTSTGSAGMRLVLRRGVLRDGEGYTFTLTVLGRSGEEEGCASIRLSPNRPPLGGSCRLFPLGAVHALTTKVHFECMGECRPRDPPTLTSWRCWCPAGGSLSSYEAVLPPGFRPHFEVGLAVVVQDQLGAAVVALNRSLAITLPEPNGSATGLTVWLHGLTASVLPGLLRQANPQHVIEYSLALVTVLNEYEQALEVAAEPKHERQRRAQIRKNITETLVSLRVHTVDDIQQIAAALAQCMVSFPPPIWQGIIAWVTGPMGTAGSEGTGPGMGSGTLTSNLAEPGLTSTAPSLPRTRDPAGSYHLNLSSHFRWSALEVSVGLYTSLCQYFSEEDVVWRTEALLPLEETSPRQAVCLTRHLTAFGASLFVPRSHVRFVFPEPTVDVNYIVMLTCAVCLVTYMVMAAIVHKLDQLDASRGHAIPFCGQWGRFKYEILVKTGWGRGSGEGRSGVAGPPLLSLAGAGTGERPESPGLGVSQLVSSSPSTCLRCLCTSSLAALGPGISAWWPDAVAQPRWSLAPGDTSRSLASGSPTHCWDLKGIHMFPCPEAGMNSQPTMSLRSSTPGEKTETVALQRLGELGPPSPGLNWEQPQAARLSRTGLVEGLRKRLLPAWCASLAHGLSLLLVAVAVAVSGWVGASFPPGVSVAWLLSSSASFLASFLGWEPLKVLLEALYFSLVAKRLHPDEDDTLVESPAVTPVSARVPRVRPPHGFALFLAKEEARKVKRLHGMLRSLLVYMLFLLVTLLASYGDASCHGHAYRLQSAIKQELHSRAFLAITRSEELWPWMAHVLLPYVHGNQSSPELGPPRLRQVRLQEALYPDPPGPRVHTCSAAGGFSTSDYDVGWGSPHNGSGTWAYSAPDLLGAWSWGSCAVYDSGGYVQELGLSLEESRDRLRFLQLHNWLDNRSRAVFVELTRYSPAVGLHAAVTLRLEFPAAGRALAALSIRPFALRRLSAGLSLPLLTSVCLLLFALHFAVAEARTWHREGRWRVLRLGAWARWLLVALTAATALVRLAQLGAADRQWTRFVRGRPRRFTSFDQVAQLSSAARGLAASLLFLLLVKAAQQLRFVRQWSVFGKTLCRALPELLGVTLGLVVLGVAYAQLAVLLVSSCVDSLWSVAQALLVLCPGTGLSTLCPAESWQLSPLLCVGLWALRLWGALRLGAVILRWRYHALRGELYRPAWEPQDYEMVELFLRRLRLWMGLSKVKEFRHKVRFEGMEPLPSRSSRGSKVSPDVPPPSAGSDASHPSTSSSQLDGLSVSLGRLGTRCEPEPSRLQAVFEALLTQFDRLNQATEDVYQLEQQLHSLQGRRSSRAPAGPSRGPSPGLRPALPSRLVRASRGVDLATGPSRTPLRAKNKVHPSST
uniref:Polycystin-1 n=1 Tax=Gorilla gorilla gorilla TaxID=9595 RepID=G3QVU1_GORGO